MNGERAAKALGDPHRCGALSPCASHPSCDSCWFKECGMETNVGSANRTRELVGFRVKAFKETRWRRLYNTEKLQRPYGSTPPSLSNNQYGNPKTAALNHIHPYTPAVSIPLHKCFSHGFSIIPKPSVNLYIYIHLPTLPLYRDLGFPLHFPCDFPFDFPFSGGVTSQ